MAIVSSAAAGLRASARHSSSATIVQLRAPGLSTIALEREANDLVATASVPVLVSSRCDVALAAGAAGVNLPENDISVTEARTLLGGRLVGRSVHSIDGARRAEQEGADFVIFGPVWPSASHPDGAPVGVAALADLVRSVQIPVIAIGGVAEGRIEEILASGAAGYAAIRLFE
jgi:thiamine-phosphate diphosphorylase